MSNKHPVKAHLVTSSGENCRQLTHALVESARDIDQLIRAMSTIVGTNPFPPISQQSREIVAKQFLPALQRIRKQLEQLGLSLNQRDGDDVSMQMAEEIAALNNSAATLVDRFGLQGPEQASKFVQRTIELLSTFSDKKVKLRREVVRSIRADCRVVNNLYISIQLLRIKQTNDQIFSQLSDLMKTEYEDPSYKGNTSVSSIIESAIADLRSNIDPSGISLECKLDIDGVDFDVDAVGLFLTVRQMIANAIKYTGDLPENTKHKETWIVLRAQNNGRHFTVSVESWGPPVTFEEYNERLIFKRHYRGRFAEASNIKGSGQGLADADIFAKKHRGEITLQTEPIDKETRNPSPRTSTFVLEIPLE